MHQVLHLIMVRQVYSLLFEIVQYQYNLLVYNQIFLMLDEEHHDHYELLSIVHQEFVKYLQMLIQIFLKIKKITNYI